MQVLGGRLYTIKKVKKSLKKHLTFGVEVCIIARPRSFLGGFVYPKNAKDG